MDALLKMNADAMWEDVIARVGMLERRALNGRRNMFYELIDKHFGSAYSELAAMKGEKA